MNLDMVISAILCILAMFVSHHHSSEARSSAIAVFIGFLLYISAWAPDGWSPRDVVFLLTGEKVKSAYFWVLCDIGVAVYIASIAVDRLWGGILPFLFMIQVCLHIVGKIYEFIPKETYLLWLDRTFDMQLFVFFFIGAIPTYRYLSRKVRSIWTTTNKFISNYLSRNTCAS